MKLSEATGKRHSGKVTTARVDDDRGISLRIAVTLLNKIDEFAIAAGMSRSEVIRAFLDEGLKRTGR